MSYVKKKMLSKFPFAGGLPSPWNHAPSSRPLLGPRPQGDFLRAVVPDQAMWPLKGSHGVSLLHTHPWGHMLPHAVIVLLIPIAPTGLSAS